MAARRRQTQDLCRRAARSAVPHQAAVSHRRVQAPRCVLLEAPSTPDATGRSPEGRAGRPACRLLGPRNIRPGSSPESAIATARWSKSSVTSWAVPCSATATSRLARGAQWATVRRFPGRQRRRGYLRVCYQDRARQDSRRSRSPRMRTAHARSRTLAWRSGPLFVSLWVRNVSGAATADVPLADAHPKQCAAMSPLPRSSAPSRWYHYQAIVTPDPGTRSLKLFLYADVYTSGALTTNEYSDVVVRRSPVALQPVVVATPRSHERPAPALYTAGESFSPDWIGPPGDQHVEVDGLRNGWLGPHSRSVPLRFGPSSWYLLSRFASLLAAGLLLALALFRWRRGRPRLVATARAALGGQEDG